MVRQFAYVHEIAGISLLLGKNTSAAVQCFSLSRNDINKTLITKMCLLRPPLYGLSLRKSPIKNRTTLFGSGRVVNWIKHNYTPQNPTCSSNVVYIFWKLVWVKKCVEIHIMLLYWCSYDYLVYIIFNIWIHFRYLRASIAMEPNF